MPSRLQLLITNDDNIYAKGLSALVEIAKKFGDVTVVAPKEAQSAQSMAVSVGKIVRLQEVSREEGVVRYYCTGTPADCVKLSMSELFADKRPDLVLSGVNHGSNASAGAMYSGTLAACAEATQYGVPAIAYSLCSHHADADFSAVIQYGATILESYIKEGIKLPDHHFLSINFPNIPISQIQGIRYSPLGHAHWAKEFEKRIDPMGKAYFWLTGVFVPEEGPDADTDYNMLNRGYITLTILKTDWTAPTTMKELEQKWILPFKTQ